MIRNHWFLIGFGADRAHSLSFWGVGPKFVKNVVLYALLKGSWRGPWETKVRIAFTIKRFGGYEGKRIRKQLVFDGSGGTLGAPQGRPRGDLVGAGSIYYCNLQ